MATEKEIRQFFMQNRPSVPEDDGFMEDLVRQIDLLPVPASLSGGDDNVCREKILERIKELADMKKKSGRRRAVAVAAVSVLCAFISLALLSLFPGMKTQAAEYAYLIDMCRYVAAGLTALCVLAVAVRRGDLYSI